MGEAPGWTAGDKIVVYVVPRVSLAPFAYLEAEVSAVDEPNAMLAVRLPEAFRGDEREWLFRFRDVEELEGEFRLSLDRTIGWACSADG